MPISALDTCCSLYAASTAAARLPALGIGALNAEQQSLVDALRQLRWDLDIVLDQIPTAPDPAGLVRATIENARNDLREVMADPEAFKARALNVADMTAADRMVLSTEIDALDATTRRVYSALAARNTVPPSVRSSSDSSGLGWLVLGGLALLALAK